jgi:hypothetical protein
MTTQTTPQAPDDVSEQIPLSFNQEFLCLFDKGDNEGPFGPMYNIVCGWRIAGKVDTAVLRSALHDVVVRHEALRTAIVRDGPVKYQRVLAPSAPELTITDIPGIDPVKRGARAEQLLIEYEAREFSAHEYPLIRAVLARFDERDAVLVIIAHHSAVDEWSMKLVVQDLAVMYAQRKGLDVTALPEVPQYRDYAAWDRARSGSPAMDKSRSYWQEKLRSAQIVPMKTDKPRSANLPKGTAAYRFLIDAELTSAALAVAKSMRSSPFMVLLAAYKVFVSRRTAATDIVVTTLASGRNQARFQQTVGSFFNLLPLRTDLAGCLTFRDVVTRTRASCIEAYAHDIPFGQLLEAAPQITAPFAKDDLAVVSFQVFQLPNVLDRVLIGDLEYSDIRRRLLSQPVTTDIPDGALWTLDIDPAGDIVGSLWFNTNLFSGNTIIAMIEQFRQVLGDMVLDPDASLEL